MQRVLLLRHLVNRVRVGGKGVASCLVTCQVTRTASAVLCSSHIFLAVVFPRSSPALCGPSASRLIMKGQPCTTEFDGDPVGEALPILRVYDLSLYSFRMVVFTGLSRPDCL